MNIFNLMRCQKPHFYEHRKTAVWPGATFSLPYLWIGGQVMVLFWTETETDIQTAIQCALQMRDSNSDRAIQNCHVQCCGNCTDATAKQWNAGSAMRWAYYIVWGGGRGFVPLLFFERASRASSLLERRCTKNKTKMKCRWGVAIINENPTVCLDLIFCWNIVWKWLS